ncbi:ferrous iron transport protein A [Scytonema sp. UIC 10036]|uniref:FeoA family protein n=1 Tax=Scytonema sp. UIC 10036 TaxID=2304196 RepID=UPI0012DA5B0D|nr:FeoA family protein [Scytonema sp. UIC 10036]MUG92613.1 ferrous iron transport protein A [Scytonema sp. UIC 10036]
MNSGDNQVNSWISAQADLSPDALENTGEARVFPLSTMQVGARVRIVSLNCGEYNNRLMGMGLMPNALLEVISCTASGSVIVALQDQRLGLDAEMAQGIQVIDTAQALNKRLSNPTPGMTTMQTPPQVSTVKLRDAAIGSVLRVVGYAPTTREYRRKLLAMGLTPGTELRVTRHAPLGDPTEIVVRDFHLSLRKDEADALIVTPVTGAES